MAAERELAGSLTALGGLRVHETPNILPATELVYNWVPREETTLEKEESEEGRVEKNGLKQAPKGKA